MQIYFIHDFARAEWDGGAAERSGRWLYALAAPLLRRCGHRTDRIGAAHPGVQRLLAGPPDPLPAGIRWPSLFSDPDAVPHHASILPYLAGAGLVVGFELSPNQMRILETARIPFIDVAIDPVRFAPDLFLALRTNDPALAKTLSRCAVPVASQACLTHCSDAIAENTLFVGQTDIDAALIVGSRLATIEPHLPDLRTQFGDGRHLLLKPHPYGRSHRDIHALHRSFPKARITSDNVYTLLASGTVAEVVTLSSSVAAEAPFFGVAATTLLQPDTAILPFVSPRIRVSPDQLPPGLFAVAGRVTPRRSPCCASLRFRLGLSWAFPAPLHLTDRRIRPNDKLDFRHSASRALLGIGWSYPEPTGCWTDGALATILVDTDGKAVELAIHYTTYQPPGTAPLRITLELRGTQGVTKHLTLRAAYPSTITVPIPPSLGLVEVAIHVNNPRSPASLGQAEDRRELGLHITDIGVSAQIETLSDSVFQIARSLAASFAVAFLAG